ncbi:MAG: hypothetical protein NC915_01910 [Candidatus Omnitrophica bacterium]|nr:hypothetical protein [Candidatus Omnitrophota bacterium]
MANLKQIWHALMMYTEDYDGWFLPARTIYPAYWNGVPSARPWFELLGKWGRYSILDYGVYIANRKSNYAITKKSLLFCPTENKSFTYTDYAINLWLVGMCQISPPYSEDPTYKYRKIQRVRNPTIAIWVVDNGRSVDHAINYTYPVGHTSGSYIAYRHGGMSRKTYGTWTGDVGMANVLFVDGHVESKTPEALCSPYSVGSSLPLRQGF